MASNEHFKLLLQIDLLVLIDECTIIYILILLSIFGIVQSYSPTQSANFIKSYSTETFHKESADELQRFSLILPFLRNISSDWLHDRHQNLTYSKQFMWHDCYTVLMYNLPWFMLCCHSNNCACNRLRKKRKLSTRLKSLNVCIQLRIA